MAARWRCMEVRRLSLAMASPGERHTSSVVTTQIYLGCLRFGWKHRQRHPRARRCGGEGAMALSVVFNVGDATVHCEVIIEAR